MMKHVPKLLIYCRLILGLLALLLSFFAIADFGLWAVGMLITGLLSDVFDGMIARQVGVSSEALRRLDSNVDQVFFISMAAAAMIHCPDFLPEHWKMISALLLSEGLCYAVSYIKFKKEVATHSIGAKFWTLTLVAALAEMLLRCESAYLFPTCVVLGILTRLEIIVILLLLKKWTHDVPSVYHALQIRRGKAIKHNRFFNG